MDNRAEHRHRWRYYGLIMQTPLSFIGKGALLSRAIDFSLKKGLEISFILLTGKDEAIYNKFEDEVEIMEVDKVSLIETLRSNQIDSKGIIFSINNNMIIPDEALLIGWDFYNIHNGLTQFHRGIGELCVFVAYTNQQNIYGATLHSIMPDQEIDTGKVISQRSFKLESDYSFEEIMNKSIVNCQKIFEENIEDILNSKGEIEGLNIQESGEVFLYNNWSKWLNADNEASLGYYSSFFPKLEELISKKYKSY